MSSYLTKYCLTEKCTFTFTLCTGLRNTYDEDHVNIGLVVAEGGERGGHQSQTRTQDTMNSNKFYVQFGIDSKAMKGEYNERMQTSSSSVCIS